MPEPLAKRRQSRGDLYFEKYVLRAILWVISRYASMSKIVTGLDIGSYEVRAVVTQLSETEAPQIIGVGRVLSRGVKKGVIVDIHEASSVIKEALFQAEEISGTKTDYVVCSVNGVNLQSASTKGVIAVSRADREISETDIDRALKAAQNASLAPNREILEIISRDFTIDNEEGIKNPIGMSGIRLEVNTVIVSAYSAFLRNLAKAVELAGWKVAEFVASPLASSQAVVSQRQKDLGVLVCDLGSDTTGVSIFEDGELLHLEVLPLGSGLITSDIAIGLRIDIDSAETIKIKYGSALPSHIRKTETIELASLGFGEDLRIRRQEVAEIIEARAKEIFSLIARMISSMGKKNFLPAGVILVGGGSKLEGISALAKEELQLPVRMGYPEDFRGLVDQITDPVFAKVCGLVSWEIAQGGGAIQEESYTKKISETFQNLFHRILP